jgi:hypothetical protein
VTGCVSESWNSVVAKRKFLVDELKYRLRKTLDFLAANQRPNWEAVVEEHTRFLEMLDSQAN